MSSVVLYISAIIAAFLSAFLAGFQGVNLAWGNRKLAIVTGGLMTLAEGSIIWFIGKGGLGVVLVAALGAAAGYGVAMYAHDWLIEKPEELSKSKVKAMIKRQIEKHLEKDK
jgi:hypothetical protein